MGYDMDGLRRRLTELAAGDEKYAQFTAALNPTASPVLGVRLPVLRKIAKEIAASDDWEDFLRETDLGWLELETLQSFVIGYAKTDIDTRLGYLRRFIPGVHDWSVCDGLCSTFKAAEKKSERAVVWDFLMGYRDSHEEFEVRVVAVMLLGHYMTEDYYPRVMEVLDGLYTGGADPKEHYYAKMGVAWAVAEAAVKFPEETYGYLSGDNKLDRWTFNKAIQKARESYRVSPEMKDRLLKLKR